MCALTMWCLATSDEKVILHDISLFAKPGQKIAFVGSTGAGKTTITNLINRFYDVPDGKIRYDGININKIKKADLRRSLVDGSAGYPPVYRHCSRTISVMESWTPPTRRS